MDDIGLKMLSMGRPIIHTALEHYTKVWGDLGRHPDGFGAPIHPLIASKLQ